jgi:hypothetical protein
MKIDLDQLKGAIEEHLRAQGFVVFRGHSRISPSIPFVYWDIDQQPDFRVFLETAKQAGVRLVVFNHREFTPDYLADAADQLESAELPREDQRRLERRLGALRGYEGFTCSIELSFDLGIRVYHFSLRTEWYEDLLELLEEIDASYPEEEEDGEEPMGGYFSKN